MIHLTERQIGDALSAYFRGNGNVVLRHVRNGTGFSNGAIRTADMLILSTWPSRGLYAAGVEIKSAKSDLKKELATPQKAEEIAQYCAQWWIATPIGLSDGMEIPPGWGLLEVDEKLKVKVAKPTTVKEAVPFTLSFACAVLRTFSESMISLDEYEQRVQSEVTRRTKDQSERKDRDLAELRKAIAAWKEATGIDLLTDYGKAKWDLATDGHAFNLVRAMRQSPSGEMLEAMEKMETAIAAMRAVLQSEVMQ